MRTEREIQKVADTVFEELEKTQPFIDFSNKMYVTGDKDVDKMILKTTCEIIVAKTMGVLDKLDSGEHSVCLLGNF